MARTFVPNLVVDRRSFLAGAAAAGTLLMDRHRRRPGARQGQISDAVRLPDRLRRDHVRRHRRLLRQRGTRRRDRRRAGIGDVGSAGDGRQCAAVTHRRHRSHQGLCQGSVHRRHRRNFSAQHLLRHQPRRQADPLGGRSRRQDDRRGVAGRSHREPARHDADLRGDSRGADGAAVGRQRAVRVRTGEARPRRRLYRHQRHRVPAHQRQAAGGRLVDRRRRALPRTGLHDLTRLARQERRTAREVLPRRARQHRRHVAGREQSRAGGRTRCSPNTTCSRPSGRTRVCRF